MSGHGSCSKLGCNCKSYSKSILTPGLCKSCNHVKDAHNQFIPDDDEDELPANNQLNDDLINPTNTTTSIDYSSDENDLNYSNHKKRKKKSYNNNNNNDNNGNNNIHDNYPQQILKKKPTTSINHTESMWKNKYEQSQKEVEHWQTKYNNLYIKYKELLSQKEQQSQSTQSTQSTQPKSGGLNQSKSTTADIDLLSFTNNDNNDNDNDNNNNNDNNSFAQWTTFD